MSNLIHFIVVRYSPLWYNYIGAVKNVCKTNI